MKASSRALGAPAPTLKRRAAIGVFAAAACAAMVFGGVVAGAAAAESTDTSGIILLAGADESQRVVNWYSSTGDAQVVQVAEAKSVKGGVFPASAFQFDAVVSANTVNGGFNGHAVLSGLSGNKKYVYRVGSAGHWSQSYEFATSNDKNSNFDFLFFGDPQIGSSGDIAADGEGWQATLATAGILDPQAQLFVSGGDQVNKANAEAEWDAFLAPDELRSTPWAATIGNHDVGGKAYEQHLWTPNTDRSPQFYRSGDLTTQSGGNYWFTYKDVLFIDLNSNAYSASGADGVDADEAHIGYVRDVIEEQGASAKHTVLVYHHSIYSPASHANDGDNQKRRQDFPTAFSELGVDLVLQGHDHAYSRSYLLRNGQKADANEQPGQETVFQGPGGVIYVTANSASGSKYYDLTAPREGSDFGPDPLNPKNHYANSVENQDHVRTYVKVEVRDGHLAVQNIIAGDCETANPAVARGKVGWCGPDEGAGAEMEVGTAQDSVVIHKYKDDGVAGAESTVDSVRSDEQGTVTSIR
ncbi:hypothetical protein QF046_003046 [Microbacterium sp. W4I4]|uniref:fibronectin type III domain-containing protein n=1 Tax=Microbacterium sp. W4I4 TaxID=3042295 RepID=UPI00277D30D4|nr:fibronectin type III domain-containing protein [Microbacterium sp. W4I4]MDQ0615405.1 hypothetical protein [Microbacterium sp. W4I4]